MVIIDKKTYFTVTVCAPKGNIKYQQFLVVREEKFNSLHSLAMSTIYPTAKELAQGYMHILRISTPNNTGLEESIDFSALNPKVKHLIATLSDADIPTTMSGDRYEDEFVYIDIGTDKKWISAVKNAKLPAGWKIDRIVEICGNRDESIRIHKCTSSVINKQEANMIKNALLDGMTKTIAIQIKYIEQRYL